MRASPFAWETEFMWMRECVCEWKSVCVCAFGENVREYAFVPVCLLVNVWVREWERVKGRRVRERERKKWNMNRHFFAFYFISWKSYKSPLQSAWMGNYPFLLSFLFSVCLLCLSITSYSLLSCRKKKTMNRVKFSLTGLGQTVLGEDFKTTTSTFFVPTRAGCASWSNHSSWQGLQHYTTTSVAWFWHCPLASMRHRYPSPC